MKRRREEGIGEMKRGEEKEERRGGMKREVAVRRNKEERKRD